jgi:hypothetical protein
MLGSKIPDRLLVESNQGWFRASVPKSYRTTTLSGSGKRWAAFHAAKAVAKPAVAKKRTAKKAAAKKSAVKAPLKVAAKKTATKKPQKKTERGPAAPPVGAA